MLTRNIRVEISLTNGLMGTVQDIQWDGSVRDKPYAILVSFNGYSGPTINNAIPVLAMDDTFPLVLAYATTIHKVQGQTLDRAAVAFQDGLVYTALSRVRRL